MGRVTIDEAAGRGRREGVRFAVAVLRRQQRGPKSVPCYRGRSIAFRIDHLDGVMGRGSGRSREHGRSAARAHAAGLDGIDGVAVGDVFLGCGCSLFAISLSPCGLVMVGGGLRVKMSMWL